MRCVRTFRVDVHFVQFVLREDDQLPRRLRGAAAAAREPQPVDVIPRARVDPERRERVRRADDHHLVVLAADVGGMSERDDDAGAVGGVTDGADPVARVVRPAVAAQLVVGGLALERRRGDQLSHRA